MKFRALVVREDENKEVKYSVKEVGLDILSEGDILVKVAYSSVNFKDTLAVKTKGGVIRNYPMIPGIDMSGEIVETKSNKYKVGQKVLVTGFEMGMTHTGGFSEYVRVKEEWIVPLPEKMSLRDAMIIGTAGFTAGLSVMALEKMGMKKENNPEILVTGATGGVGSIGVQLLKASGFENINTLSRDKNLKKDALNSLGIKNTYELNDIVEEKDRKRVLGKQKFNYILDTVGGEVVSTLIPVVSYGGSVSMCGNASGIKFETTVLPFILRGVNILGIDSVNVPIENRFEIWERFTKDWNIVDKICVNEVKLDGLKEVFDKIQKGIHVGRTIVKIG